MPVAETSHIAATCFALRRHATTPVSVTSETDVRTTHRGGGALYIPRVPSLRFGLSMSRLEGTIRDEDPGMSRFQFPADPWSAEVFGQLES